MSNNTVVKNNIVYYEFMLSQVNLKKANNTNRYNFWFKQCNVKLLVNVETNIGIGYANGFHSDKSRDARTVGRIGHKLYLQHICP